MNRKAIKLISCVLLMALLLAAPVHTARADSSGVTFTAANDRVLDLSMMPVTSGGKLYLPASLFQSYFGVTYSYFSSSNTAMLNVGTTMLLFDLTAGTCKNGNDKNSDEFPYKAISINGTIYVSMYIGRYFGLTYSTITGNGYGDLLRIVNGAQILTDAQFLDGASSFMKDLYKAYTGGNTPSGTTPPSVSEPPEITGAEVYICFVGLPSAELLDTFKNYGACATFFLSAEDARSNPDLVRRAAGEGHTIGIYCSALPEEECTRAMEAVEEAAFVRPTIMFSSHSGGSAAEKFARENGLVFYVPTVNLPPEIPNAAAITSELPQNAQACGLLLLSNEDIWALMPAVLQYLRANSYTAPALLETSLQQAGD